ncbi:hypothetical protein K474DRAFT_1679876 [Panus rudis PR-1116 ss-1]|nr:hypothetical protein K474DRAFT_1679876 [Panus rudis PR-1116 ss-1]
MTMVCSCNTDLGDVGVDSKIVREPSFHTKSNLIWPSLPVKGSTLLGRLWLLLPSGIRLFCYKTLFRIGETIWPFNPVEGGAFTQKLPFGLWCKFGGRINKDEVLATMFVAANTTIPVPRILDTVDDDDGSLFVLMSQVPGTQASKVFEDLDENGRSLFELDLRDWLYQLRSIVPPSSAVGSFTGGPTLQFRYKIDPIGPFENIEAFHRYFLDMYPQDAEHDLWQAYLRTARAKVYRRRHEVCFTHGDLRLHNLQMKDGRLSGMLDFGSSGWLPEYWEYGTATYRGPKPWIEILGRIFAQYSDEREVNTMLMGLNPDVY